MGQFDIFNECAITHPNTVFLVKVPEVQRVLESKGLKVILCPWLMSVDDAISLNKSNAITVPAPADHKSKPYFSLNNNYRLQKSYLLFVLQQHDILDCGFVTANHPKFNKNIQSGNMMHYTDVPSTPVVAGAGYERVVSQVNNVPVTANALNFSKVINSVNGCVQISVETSIRSFFPTEKTLMPLAIGKLPLWVGKCGLVQEVRNEGFDVFDDLIDHSYDLISNPKRRIIGMVNSNLTLLTNTSTINKYNGVQKRLQQNIEHFKYNWLNLKLTQLVKDIEQHL
jgi:hypothetical protein